MAIRWKYTSVVGGSSADTSCGTGVMMPAIHAMIARWSAPEYRSLVVSAIFLGMDVGVIVIIIHHLFLYSRS